MSDYSITIRGRDGIIFDAEIDETLRLVRRLALDDSKLKELLVLTSVCGGSVEGELMKAHAQVRQGSDAEDGEKVSSSKFQVSSSERGGA